MTEVRAFYHVTFEAGEALLDRVIVGGVWGKVFDLHTCKKNQLITSFSTYRKQVEKQRIYHTFAMD